jgi:hypothetical protein
MPFPGLVDVDVDGLEEVLVVEVPGVVGVTGATDAELVKVAGGSPLASIQYDWSLLKFSHVAVMDGF